MHTCEHLLLHAHSIHCSDTSLGNPNAYLLYFSMQLDNHYAVASPPSSLPSLIHRLRFSLCSSCCLGAPASAPAAGPGGEEDDERRGPSLLRSSTIWIRSRAQELPEIGGRCRNLVARIGRHNAHAHRGSGDFRYDPLSYALNFDEGVEDDALSGAGYRYRSFSSRLPPSPPHNPDASGIAA